MQELKKNYGRKFFPELVVVCRLLHCVSFVTWAGGTTGGASYQGLSEAIEFCFFELFNILHAHRLRDVKREMW